jgi:hypothetical protein
MLCLCVLLGVVGCFGTLSTTSSILLLNMESVYHIVAIRVNETSWAHVWRLHFRYLGTGYDTVGQSWG